MSFKFECNECENEFLHKSELMKHKKDKQHGVEADFKARINNSFRDCLSLQISEGVHSIRTACVMES